MLNGLGQRLVRLPSTIQDSLPVGIVDGIAVSSAIGNPCLPVWIDRWPPLPSTCQPFMLTTRSGGPARGTNTDRLPT